MINDEPILLVELNKDNLIFVAGKYDEEQNFKIVEKLISVNDGIGNHKFSSLEKVTDSVKKNISKIEQSLNYVFKEIIIILDNFNYSSLNISGFKKLNGSQVLKENISYILNSLKSAVLDNEKNKTILHIFNSKSVLDGKRVDNLPIGLFGNFYVHELSFFLIENNELKNIKQIFSKFNISVKKIFIKSFIEGTQLINKKKTNTFFKINIYKDYSNLVFYDRGALVYFEKFSFGSNIILKDISKVCSIDLEIINKILNDNMFVEKHFQEEEYLDEKYFVNINFRKIRKKLILEIAYSRINEICNIILNKNINLKTILNFDNFIYLNIEDTLLKKNFAELFKKSLFKFLKENIQLEEKIDLTSNFVSAADLSLYGWNKEAIPVTQTKNSLITRLFKSIFG